MLRGDDADVLPARGLERLRLDGDAAGDDEHADALADGDVLDVPAVADDDAAFFRRKLFEPRGEGFQAHRADHQNQFILALRVHAHDEFAVERAGEVGQRRQDFAGILPAGLPADGGKKEFAQLEEREQAAAFVRGVHHGQDAEIFFVHQPQRLRRRGVGPHAQDFPLHHVGDFRRDVRDEFRRGHAERFQHEINAVIRVAAARGDGFRQTGAALEFRVADGGTDGVRVGIPMADDEDFTHAMGRRLTRLGGGGKRKAERAA